MSIHLAFTKMHGAGNDFVMIDAREMGALPMDASRIAAICDRRTGVGADGLIIISEDTQEGVDFRMTYFNADGGEAEMCGNGARCSVEFAHRVGLCGEQTRFMTYSGILEGRVFGQEDIQVSLPAYRDLALDVDLNPRAETIASHHTCNTGVPHLVIPVADTDAVEVENLGREYRQDPFFAPAGTNVNFVAPAPEGDHFLLRTYERGVEAETLACGTGASACAVVLCELGKARSPVSLMTRGGHMLQVSIDRENQGLLLRGPAVTSFLGVVQFDG